MPRRKLTIALAGNANVGKSVLFNQLTGLHQHIGNWPGKTVERAEGTLHFKGYTIDIIDLPGIYSLSTYSLEELVSRKFIAVERPDLVINVVDASVLERNLFFTLQLIELETPMIIALNQMDMAKRKGIGINIEKLEKVLGIPVIPTVAIKRTGIFQLLEKAIEMLANRPVVTEIQLISGRFDIIALARFHSTDNLSEFIAKELSNLEGVKDSETFICLEVKKGRQLPLS